MKGLIVYSSVTGNTKKMAEKLQEGLAEHGEWDCVSLKEGPSPAGYDVVLIGGWIDRGHLDKKCMDFLGQIDKEQQDVGLFGTLGAMPDSAHGKQCYQALQEDLAGYRGIGVKLLPGLVSQALIDRVEKIPDDAIPAEIRQGMIDAGVNSRWATEEEYAEAIAYFRQQLGLA